MVKLTDLDDFLKPEDVKDGDIVTFTSAGVMIPASESKWGKSTFRMSIRLPDGRTKTAPINKTSLRALVPALGDDTSIWANHQARIVKIRQPVQGEIKDVIYFYPVSTTITAPSQLSGGGASAAPPPS